MQALVREGHESYGALKGMIYPTSAGTLTLLEHLKCLLRAPSPPYPNDLQLRVIYFVLMRMVRSCVHVIKLPNPLNKMEILKILIFAKF
jgi:hypothetical protein